MVKKPNLKFTLSKDNVIRVALRNLELEMVALSLAAIAGIETRPYESRVRDQVGRIQKLAGFLAKACPDVRFAVSRETRPQPPKKWFGTDEYSNIYHDEYPIEVLQVLAAAPELYWYCYQVKGQYVLYGLLSLTRNYYLVIPPDAITTVPLPRFHVGIVREKDKTYLVALEKSNDIPSGILPCPLEVKQKSTE